jgi:tetratricopeptide (TPR) repeat protein
MKKKILYLLLFVIAALAFMVMRFTKTGKAPDTVYSNILPRTASLAYAAEWAVVKNNAAVLINKIRQNPGDVKSLMVLTALYIQEARNTGNFNYYNAAALKCIDAVLKKDPDNFEALTFKATILLSQHRFAEGLAIASQAQQRYPLNAYVYGLMIDGHVELGHYQQALEAADKMVSIRPDIRSYSRIAYLREIYGDIPGAIEAMQLAIDAGAPGDENTEWCRVQLGKLYEKTGQLTRANMQYAIAVDNRPGYPYALAGLARIAVAEKKYGQALGLYQRADSLIPDHTFKEGMAEVYRLMGEPEKAQHEAAAILKYMLQFSSGNQMAAHTGQNEDHELAHAYMGVGNYSKALEMALAEYHRRPANIEVNETVAMVYYHKGNYAQALPYITTALQTHCSNPELLCHAGLIYAKTGAPDKAREYLQHALKNHPLLPAQVEEESRAAMEGLAHAN